MNDSRQFPSYLQSMHSQIGPRKKLEIKYLNYRPKNIENNQTPLKFAEEVKQIEIHFDKVAEKASTELFLNEKELLNIVPKKSNIDLKRNISKKLDKISKKTSLAILEILKDKLRAEKNTSSEIEKPFEKEREKKVENTVYGSKIFDNNIVYDSEFYDKFEDFEEIGGLEGIDLAAGINYQEKLYEENDDSDEERKEII